MGMSETWSVLGAGAAFSVCLGTMVYLSVSLRTKVGAVIRHLLRHHPQKISKLLDRGVSEGGPLRPEEQRKILLFIADQELPQDEAYTRLRQECLQAGRQFKWDIPVCFMIQCLTVLYLLAQYKTRFSHSQKIMEMVVFFGLFVVLVVVLTFFRIRMMGRK